MPERIVPVTIELPASTWWMLAKIADGRGIKVAQLVAERALRAPVGKPGTLRVATSERVADLHAQGKTDRDIARTLFVDKSTVRYHRSRLGLPANPAR